MRKKYPNADFEWIDDPTPQRINFVNDHNQPLYVVNQGENIGDGLSMLQSALDEYNRKRLSMKHKITVVLCVIAIFTAGLFTAQTYKQYQSWRAEENAKATAASQAEAHKNIVQQTIFNAEVKQLEDQCSSDKASYNLLTPAQKAKTTPPQCDLNLVQ